MYKLITLILVNASNHNLIQIFDESNIMIINSYVTNEYHFKGKVNSAYKIKIIANNNTLITSIYISNKYKNYYIFDLKRKELFHKIFIKLIDQNYSGLLLKKGEIKLWPNHII